MYTSVKVVYSSIVKTVGLKFFRTNLRKCLREDLPLALTHRGQTLAIVVSSAFFDYLLTGADITRGTAYSKGGGGAIPLGEAGDSAGDAPAGGDSPESGEGPGV